MSCLGSYQGITHPTEISGLFPEASKLHLKIIIMKKRKPHLTLQL